MQLTLHIPGEHGDPEELEGEFSVANEADINKAGFAVARSVRAWLRRMPFVPSTGDLHYNIYAEVGSDAAAAHGSDASGESPRPKRKRKKDK